MPSSPSFLSNLLGNGKGGGGRRHSPVHYPNKQHHKANAHKQRSSNVLRFVLLLVLLGAFGAALNYAGVLRRLGLRRSSGTAGSDSVLKVGVVDDGDRSADGRGSRQGDGIGGAAALNRDGGAGEVDNDGARGDVALGQGGAVADGAAPQSRTTEDLMPPVMRAKLRAREEYARRITVPVTRPTPINDEDIEVILRKKRSRVTNQINFLHDGFHGRDNVLRQNVRATPNDGGAPPRDEAFIAEAEEAKYRLAKPLPGQMSSDEFFRPSEDYSSWWCGGPPGNKDVFGQMLDPRHYCVFRNVCMVGGIPTIYPRSRDEVPGLEVDKKRYGGLPHAAYPREAAVAVHVGDEGATLKKARKQGRFVGGLTAITTPTHGQEHITHIMEPLGQLFHALNIFGMYQDHGEEGVYMKTPLGPTLDDAPELLTNLHAFKRSPFALKHAELERILFVATGGPNKASFQEQIYHMIFTNRRSKGVDHHGFARSELKPRVMASFDSFDGACFDEMIMAGASYDPYHQIHMPSFHRQRDWFYGVHTMPKAALSALQEGIAARNAVQPSDKAEQLISKAIAALPQRQQDEGTPRQMRRVLVAHRSEKRRVRDADGFNAWLAEQLPALVPEYDWEIRAVNYRFLSNDERVHLAYWADIFIGIHGADLTNLVSMRPSSVVVELYPILFFESRFYEMAQSMQLHYFAWTCTRQECTSLDVQRLQIHDGHEVAYNASSGMLRLNPNLRHSLSDGDQRDRFDVHEELHKKTDGWFKWPTDRYVGHSCLGCDLMTCCTALHNTMYGPQRDSDVIFGTAEFEEMLVLLRQAAAAVGTAFKPFKRVPYAQQLLEAKEANAAANL